MSHRLTRYRWRIAAVASAVLLAATALPLAPTTAIGIGQMDKVSDTYYRDPACGGSDPFIVDIWTDAGYQGTRFRFCSNHSNFCWSPFGNDSSSAQLCDAFGIDVPTANDRASSVKVVAVNGGSLCYVQFRDNADYTGAEWRAYDPKNDSDLGPVWPNDTWSSVRRGGTCN